MILNGISAVLDGYKEVEETVLVFVLNLVSILIENDQLRLQLCIHQVEDVPKSESKSKVVKAKSLSNLPLKGGIPCLFSLVKILECSKDAYTSSFCASLLDVLIVACSYPGIVQELCNNDNKYNVKFVKTVIQLMEGAGEDLNLISRCLSLISYITSAAAADKSYKLVDEKVVVDLIKLITRVAEAWIAAEYPSFHFFIIIINNIVQMGKRESVLIECGIIKIITQIIGKVVNDSQCLKENNTTSKGSEAGRFPHPDERILILFKNQITQRLVVSPMDMSHTVVETCMSMLRMLISSLSTENQKKYGDSKNDVFRCLIRVLSKSVSEKDGQAQRVAEASYKALKIIVPSFENDAEGKKMVTVVKKVFPHFKEFTSSV
jgi:hypothetical protein